MRPFNESVNKIIDISPVISSSIAVFPGDTPFQNDFILDLKLGDNLTLSKITTTTHLGAHTDAPSHYSANGQSINERPLSTYIGLSQVIHVKCAPHSRIKISDISHIEIIAPRILFKTSSYPNPDKWNDDFVAFSVELINYLADKKVILVGIDTPSVDLFDDQEMESHKAIFLNDMAILEGIVLENAEEGLYELVALPLNIKGADATPVRAILIK
jgi:arylformamidase